MNFDASMHLVVLRRPVWHSCNDGKHRQKKLYPTMNMSRSDFLELFEKTLAVFPRDLGIERTGISLKRRSLLVEPTANNQNPTLSLVHAL